MDFSVCVCVSDGGREKRKPSLLIRKRTSEAQAGALCALSLPQANTLSSEVGSW